MEAPHPLKNDPETSNKGYADLLLEGSAHLIHQQGMLAVCFFASNICLDARETIHIRPSPFHCTNKTWQLLISTLKWL